VTYVTTGSNPVTTELAASPPRDFAFGTTVSGQILDVISNSKGEFACSRGLGASATWSCIESKGQRSRPTNSCTRSTQALLDRLPQLYSAAAALQGVTIHSTTMSVNGFGSNVSSLSTRRAPARASGA